MHAIPLRDRDKTRRAAEANRVPGPETTSRRMAKNHSTLGMQEPMYYIVEGSGMPGKEALK